MGMRKSFKGVDSEEIFGSSERMRQWLIKKSINKT